MKKSANQLRKLQRTPLLFLCIVQQMFKKIRYLFSRKPEYEMCHIGQHEHTKNSKHDYHTRIGTRINSTTQY